MVCVCLCVCVCVFWGGWVDDVVCPEWLWVDTHWVEDGIDQGNVRTLLLLPEDPLPRVLPRR